MLSFERWVPRIRMAAVRVLLTHGLVCALGLAEARASALTGFLPELNSLTDSVTKALVSAVGFGIDHHPMDGVTPLGKTGFEMGIVVVASRFPDALQPALEAAGVSTAALSLGVLPAPKIFLRKGLGTGVNIGLSGLYYRGVSLLGGDITWNIHEPEEGVSWGFRLNYASSNVLYAKTQTVRPELLVSRALEFADPYVGIGAQIAWGSLTVDVEPIPGFSQQIQASGRAQSFIAFLGNKFRIPGLNLLLAIEGGYSSAGMSWLATRAGLAF